MNSPLERHASAVLQSALGDSTGNELRVHEVLATVSAAISLKRIADLLDGTHDGLEKTLVVAINTLLDGLRQ